MSSSSLAGAPRPHSAASSRPWVVLSKTAQLAAAQAASTSAIWPYGVPKQQHAAVSVLDIKGLKLKSVMHAAA